MLKVAINLKLKSWTVFDEAEAKTSEVFTIGTEFTTALWIKQEPSFYFKRLYENAELEIYNLDNIINVKIDKKVSYMYLSTFFLKCYFNNESFPYKKFQYVQSPSYTGVFIEIGPERSWERDPYRSNKSFFMKYDEQRNEVTII